MNNEKTLIAFATIWMLLASFHPQAEAKRFLIEKVVAVVNDEVITLTELQEASQPLLRQAPAVEGGRASLQATQQQILEGFILQRLQLQEGKKVGIIASPAEVAAALEEVKRRHEISSDKELEAALSRERLTLKQLKQGLTEQIILNKLLNQEVRSKVIVLEEEIQRYYQANLERYRRPPEVRLRYILIAVPPGASTAEEANAKARAEKVLAALRAGADFAEMAKRYSDGPTAKEGGSVGKLRKDELTPELAEVAFRLPVGSVSELLQTPAGFTIVKVEERWEDPFIPLAEVKELIRNTLLGEKAKDKMQEWIDALKAKASIEVKGWEAQKAEP